MLLGLTMMFATILNRGSPSIAGSRLLLFGPGVALLGGALIAAQLPVDLALRLAVIVTSIGSPPPLNGPIASIIPFRRR